MPFFVLLLAAICFQQSRSYGILIVHHRESVDTGTLVLNQKPASPFIIQVDNGKKYQFSNVKDIVFDSLELNKRHLFRDYGPTGKVEESFYFSFEKSSNTLHLRFHNDYANWRMD